MTGDDDGMCVLPSDTRSMMNIPPSTTSMEFINLAEFSTYTFTVNTVALVDTSNPSSTTFTTPSSDMIMIKIHIIVIQLSRGSYTGQLDIYIRTCH